MDGLVVGDLVSLSRAQSNRIAVLTLPSGGPLTYTVMLPINGELRSFSYTAPDGSNAASIVAGLLAVLLNEQTVYVVALAEDVVSTLLVVGRIGESFTYAATGNLEVTLLLPAKLAVDGRTGNPIGPIRLLETENTIKKLRRYATRDNRTGVTVIVHELLGRELDSNNVFEFEASEVMTFLGSDA